MQYCLILHLNNCVGVLACVLDFAMVRTIALFGGIGSAVFCLYFSLIYALWGNPFLDAPKSVDFFIYLLSVAGGIAYLRYLVVGKDMSFRQGLFAGLGITTTLVVVSTLFIYLFVGKIAPDALQAHIKERVGYFAQHKKEMVAHLDAQIKKATNPPKGVTAEKLHQEKVDGFKQLTAWDMAYVEVSKFVLGIFISLIVALFLRK